MTAAEEWRPIVGAPYMVSSEGRVVSRVRPESPRLLRPHRRRVSGYEHVNICSGGETRTTLVHRLVAEAFLGPCPVGLEVRHRNGIAWDNRVANLTYGTHAENMQDRLRHGRNPNSNKTHCPRRHPYDESNTLVSGSKRICRTCRRERRTEQSFRAAGIPA